MKTYGELEIETHIQLEKWTGITEGFVYVWKCNNVEADVVF